MPSSQTVYEGDQPQPNFDFTAQIDAVQTIVDSCGVTFDLVTADQGSTFPAAFSPMTNFITEKKVSLLTASTLGSF